MNKPHSKYFPDSFYRVSVKGACVKDRRILLVKESQKLSGQWELPGGGLDFGENIKEGLKREIEEEMGLKVTSVSEQPFYTWTSHFENRRGIDWYYSLVLVYQIQLENLDFTPSEECEEIGFFSLEDLKTHDLCHQSLELRNVFKITDFH